MKFDFDEIKQYIDQCSDQSRIYIGCDSERFRKKDVWYAEYTLVVVIHKDGNNGCKVFGHTITEKDYDQNKKKPALRLMNETYKVVDLYHKLYPIVKNREIEIHLDINPNEQHGSSCVVTQAIGYVRGVCGIVPKIKPEAFAASTAADEFKYKVVSS